ncbi:MAG: NMD3-related protein [Candidatus Aenigmarchaeota archaeon]|nr:NMD3-related protein [Candidatus Aenigmarchaeota archaeon]
MSRKFCPKCGKTAEKFYENLCKDCFLSKISFSKLIPDRIVIKRCKSCNRTFSDNRAASVENALESILSNLLIQPEIKKAIYRIEDKKVHINLNLKIADLEKTEEKISNLIIKKITCRACSMRSIGYYQSILQVRAPENLLGKISKEIEERINILSQYDNLAFISRYEEVANGFDVYIGSKRSALEIAKNLKNKLKANIKISRKLSGSIRGKKVYKDTILVSIGG